jgi:polysaccharide deacetylase 2 family uncharacterized protein YibQ
MIKVWGMVPALLSAGVLLGGCQSQEPQGTSNTDPTDTIVVQVPAKESQRPASPNVAPDPAASPKSKDAPPAPTSPEVRQPETSVSSKENTSPSRRERVQPRSSNPIPTPEDSRTPSPPSPPAEPPTVSPSPSDRNERPTLTPDTPPPASPSLRSSQPGIPVPPVEPPKRTVPPPDEPSTPAPPKRKPERSPSKGSGRLAIIIDDVGMSTSRLSAFLDLDADITYSILPGTRYAKRCLSMVQAKGRLPMLHLPMEPTRRKDLLPPDAITVDLDDREIERRVARSLDELKGVRGVNNHMGSRATQDSRVMENVLSVVKERGLFFVDSKTANETAVAPVARKLGVPLASRTGEFLDDGGNTSRAYEILLDLGRKAQRNGSAIGIGHPHPGTAQAVARALPELEAMGVQIVPVSDLVH